MTQPLDQQLPTQYSGENFAPAKPLLALRENNGHTSPYSQHYLADAVKEKYNDLIKRHDPEFKEMVAVGQMIALYIEGKQFLDWNPYSHSYVPRKTGRRDPSKIHAINLMQSFCTEWQDKWGSSNPDIILNPLSNEDQDIAKARKANAVVNHLERKMYDAWYKYHEGLMAQIFGWYANRVRPCYKNGQQIFKPRIEETEVQIGQGWGKCHDCEHSGAQFNSLQIDQDTSMPVCPECGSTAVVVRPPITQLMPSVNGHDVVTIPKIIAEQLPFPACRWNPRFRAEESSWFIYEQEVSVNTIRNILGNIRVPEGESGNKEGLDVLSSLAQTGSPVGGRSDVTTNPSKKEDSAVISEVYMSADDLYDIIIKGDEATVDGGMLPVGQRGSEMFPGGACALLLNGSLLVGLYKDHHSITLTTGVYHMKPLSGTGRGVADVLEAQKRFTRFDSQAVNAMAATATPATLHVAGAIKEQDRKLLNRSDVDIPVNMQNFPEVRSLHDLVAPMQRQMVPGDMLQYTYTHLMSFMQRLYHTTSLGGVNPQGVQNDTATYAQIADQNSNSLFTPSLTLKADTYLKTAHKAFDLWCRLTPVPTFVSFKSASGSGARGMELSGEDVKGEYEWAYTEGSELPKNKLSKRKDMVQFYGLFGGIMGYIEAKQTNPQEVAETERVFDMDFATDDYDETGETCRTRLEMAKGLLEQGEMMRQQASEQYGVQVPEIDPMLILPEVKPTMLITESKLVEKGLWFSNLLDTTEGQEMTDPERNLVSAFVKGFAMLAQGQEIVVQTGQAEVAVAASAPMETANAQKEAAMIGQQQEIAAQERQVAEQEGQVAHDRQMEAEGVKLAGEVVKTQLQGEQKAKAVKK